MSTTAPESKPCGCEGPCSSRCRLDRYAIRMAQTLAKMAQEGAPESVNGTVQALLGFQPGPLVLRRLECPDKATAKKLKPAALNILGLLQSVHEAPWTELQRVGGRRFSGRIEELRAAGHRIIGPKPARRKGIHETTDPGPRGEDMYRLEA